MNTESKKEIKTKELMKVVSAVTKFIAKTDKKAASPLLTADTSGNRNTISYKS